ncbi:general negative regulator of transcription subunit 5 [Tulasnella sp. 427]|nr:general negative regulator of transcription subunit 5 [Tulasnella sp. 427]
MAARKLQTEIDRTLKKISEGVELFESIYDKMQSTTNQAQKEKLETDLKTQIKKLQRQRDQIKVWVAGNDIKDKTVLMDNRRLIETQMEKFKACEKEMKTKAFSKEGLIAAQKLDPKEREKTEVSEWISNMLSELQRQIEQTEAEIASTQVTTRKKKGASANGKADELTQLNNRRSWHVGRLEIILRLISNGSITPESVVAIKDDVQYFVESNTEEDFEENEYLYDELNLDEEDQWAVGNDENHSEDEQSLVSADVPPSRSTKERNRSTHEDPPLTPSQTVPPTTIAPPPPGMPAPTARSANGPSQNLAVQPQVPASIVSANPSPLPQQVQQSQSSQNDALAPQRPVGTQPGQSAPQPQRTNLPGSLGDLVSSFEAVKQKAAQRMANPDQMHKLLEVAMNGTPQPTDTEKPKYYVPRNQYNTPPYYPQTPLTILSSPALFAQLDVETLFYVFYFLPGTYQQYLAAQQLKNQSWRFHVKYLTWFQRHSEPQAITEEYEQGVYVYFDWEGSWCQRKKSDFRFEYRYLSED